MAANYTILTLLLPAASTLDTDSNTYSDQWSRKSTNKSESDVALGSRRHITVSKFMVEEKIDMLNKHNNSHDINQQEMCDTEICSLLLSVVVSISL